MANTIVWHGPCITSGLLENNKKALLWNIRLVPTWKATKTMAWIRICTLTLWLSENEACVTFYSLSMNEEAT
jgi:hypothetical protein